MKAKGIMVPVFDLQTHHAKVEVPSEFDLRDLAKKYAVFPLKVIYENGRRKLLLAMKNPFDHAAIQDVEFRAGISVMPVQADNKDIQWLMHTHYFGRKLSPLPSGKKEDTHETHDVFAQFEIVSKIHKRIDRFERFTQTIKPFTKESE